MNYLSLARYTQEAWSESFPKKSHDWEPNAFSEDVKKYLIESVRMLNKTGTLNQFDGIRVVTIGEEWLSYCKENNIPNTQEERRKYMHNLSNDEVQRLFRKSGMNKAQMQCFIPLIYIGKEKNLEVKLSEETTKKLRCFLESLFIGLKVYVPGYIRPLLEYQKENQLFAPYYTLANQYFKDGTYLKLYGLEEQKLEDNLMCIPFTTQEEYNECIFLKENAMTETDLMADKILKNTDLEKLKNTEIMQSIVKELEEQSIIVSPIIFPKRAISEFIKNVITSNTKHLKKKGK